MELTRETLLSIAERPGMLAAFPFLRSLTRLPTNHGGCGGCSAAPGASWKSVAAAVFQLAPDRRAQFKALAGSDLITRRVVRAGRVMTDSL